MFPIGYLRTPPKRTLSQNAASDRYCFSLNSTNQDFTLDLGQTSGGDHLPALYSQMAGRSPGKSSPGRSNTSTGRCVRELEEQLEELRKENFNLKLKIYFLEERFGRLYGVGEKSDLAKNNIELQVEVESLKNELSDKVELLKQATVAIENLEKKHVDFKKERVDMEKTITGLKEELNKIMSNKYQDTEVNLQSDPSTCYYLEAFGNNATPNNRVEDERVVAVQKELTELRDAFEKQGLELLTCQERLALSDKDLASKSEMILAIENELSEKVSQLNDLSRVLADSKNQIESLKSQLQTRNEVATSESHSREKKFSVLKSDADEKEKMIDKLLKELDEWKEVMKRKDEKVIILQEELSRKEPEIEYKAQEIEQKIQMIEEREEQIEQQNKILVEIQITLDEKQKQIQELENALREKTTTIEELESNLKKAGRTLQGFVTEIQAKEKELETMSSDSKKKEKKIRDLTCELKEVKDMLNKAKWEAQTVREDNVSSMAEEENESLKDELIQKNKSLEGVKDQLRSLNELSDDIQSELDLKNQQVNELQKENNSLKKRRSSSSSRKLASVENTRHLSAEDLKKLLNDTAQQLSATQNEKLSLLNDVANLKAKLNEYSRRSSSGEVKDLQRLIKVKDVEIEKNQKDLTRLKEEVRKLREKELELENCRRELQKSKALLSPKDQTPIKRRLDDREKEIEKLKGEIQQYKDEKEEERKKNEDYDMKLEGLLLELKNVKDENLEIEKLREKVQDRNVEIKEMTNQINELEIKLSESCRRSEEIEYKHNQDIKCHLDKLSQLEKELKMKVEENREFKKSLAHTQMLLSNAENSSEKLTSKDLVPRELFEKVIAEKSDRIAFLETTEKNLHHQVDSLKVECDMHRAQSGITLVQSLVDETKRQQEMVCKYKEEVVKLRKRLADSTNACDLLRTRLEEMADFLEEVLNMDERGLVDLSNWSFKQKQKLHLSIAESRELSRTLSQSLMIGIEDPERDLSVLDGFISSTSVSSWSVSKPDDLHGIFKIGESELITMDNSEVFNWSHLLTDRKAGQAVEVESHGDKVCIIDRSLYKSEPIQSADYDVIMNREEQRDAAAKLSQELEDKVVELATSQKKLLEYERKIQDQCLIIDNLKRAILNLEELHNKKDDERSRTDSAHVHESKYSLHESSSLLHESNLMKLVLSDAVTQTDMSVSTRKSETSTGHATTFDEEDETMNEQSKISKNVSTLSSFSDKRSDRGVYDTLQKESSVIHDNQKVKVLSSTPFSRQVDLFKGLERPNFSLSGASIKASPFPSVHFKTLTESDSEDWSEPDRDISQQRIGLESVDSDQLQLKDEFSESESQVQQSAKPSPRKLRENIRELKTLKSQFKELKVSTQMLRTEVEVYQTISNQLRRFLPSRTKSELNQPIEYVYELLSMVGDLTEKRRIIEEHESAKNGITRLKRVTIENESDKVDGNAIKSKPSNEQISSLLKDYRIAAGEVKAKSNRLQKALQNHNFEELEKSADKTDTLNRLEIKLKKANCTIKDLQEKGLLMKDSLVRKEARLSEKDNEISRLGFVIKEKEFALKEYTLRIAELETEKQSLHNLIENLKASSELGERRNLVWKNTEKENFELKKEVGELQTRVEKANSLVMSLQKEIDSYKCIVMKMENSKDLQDKVKSLEKSLEELSTEKDFILKQVDQKHDEIKTKNATIETLRNELRQRNDLELNHIRNQLENAEECITDFESTHQNFMEAGDQCDENCLADTALGRPASFVIGAKGSFSSNCGTTLKGNFDHESAIQEPSSHSRLTAYEDDVENKDKVVRQLSEVSELSEATLDDMQDITSLSFKGFTPPIVHVANEEISTSPPEVKSPDLGIESDPTSRFSSLGHSEKSPTDKGVGSSCKNCLTLSVKYQKAKKALAITAEKLRASNERKEKIDNALNKELIKTHGVLRQAKGYLELCQSVSKK
ncbi:early endosome antigen 1-like isoform X3 [Artemia franciscana]|uniref:early endosome antigen 1-like isoform X3 n=2 Tax=Artemia franciscana TaxID=6661 RepID=UPI0032D9F22A